MLTPHFSALEAAYQLHFYFCFKTKRLRPVFATETQTDLINDVLNSICYRKDLHLLQARVTPDHLKLLLSLRPEQTVSQAAQMLKGTLARRFATEFPQQLRAHHIDTLWARGYFARSSGKVNLEGARNYVSSQISHHGYQGNWTKSIRYVNPAFKSPAYRLPHCRCMLDYHLVLATDRRIPLFDEAIAPGLFECIQAVGRKHKFMVERMSLLPDHLHLIIEAVPSVSIEECAAAILNNTQYWMARRYSGVLKEADAWNVWRPSFYAGTVGEYSTAEVKKFLAQN